jgi:DNA processing protein
MNALEQNLSWAALLRAPYIAPLTLRSALHTLGDVAALTRCSPATLVALGLSPAAAAFLAHPPRQQLAADIEWLAHSGAQLLTIADPQYPPQLAALNDAPLALYVRGDPSLLSHPQMAVVGSRNPTAGGEKICLEITQALCAAGLVITSGLARGIDAAAHRAALSCGSTTVAVCGTGLDRCYPPEHEDLMTLIEASGVLVSEFAPGTAARRTNFPRRNRIISGLARGTVVIEAASKSGSLITAKLAAEQGREVFAVPGSVLNPQAAGCLELIRHGASLVRNGTDIIEQIKIPIEGKILSNQYVDKPSRSAIKQRQLDKDSEMLLDALGFEPASIDDLVDRTGFAPGLIAAKLLELELAGQLETRPGALFYRI